MDTLRKYTGDINELGKAEQFFLSLMRVPDLRERLKSLVFKREFDTKVHDILADIEIVDSAMNELREAPRLRKILEVKNTIFIVNILFLSVHFSNW